MNITTNLLPDMQPAEKVTYKLNFGYYTSFKNSRLMRITEVGNFSKLIS